MVVSDPGNTAVNTKNTIESTAQTVNQVKQEVKQTTSEALLSASLASLVSGASFFLNKLAYDSAKYIASGGKGQGALAFKSGFVDYLATTASDAAATAITAFGSANGLNLCQPASIGVLKDLQTSLNHIYNDLNYRPGGGSGSGSGNAGPQPSCKWSEFQKNWEAVPDMFGKDAISEKFAVSLDSVQSDFGIALGALAKLDLLVSNEKEAATAARLEGNGFKPVVSTISGAIKTPGSFIFEESKTISAHSQGQQNANQLSGLYGVSNWSIIPSALSIFANTLVSGLLSNIFTKGILPDDGSSGNALDYAASTLNNNRQVAEKVFSFLTVGLPQRNLSSYDIVTQYSSCPENPGLNNCVMDSGLVQALDRGRSSNPITIKEALKAGLLHGNWYLVPSTDIVQNTDINCYRNAYCFSNIQKMRKARILPLGFEIAARKSNPDSPYTLQQYIDGYNICNSDFTPDPATPFCHLIDPNWLLEVPEAICEAQVNGPLVASQVNGQRSQECVDFSSCLAYNANGDCKSFGYCTQEKNVWNIPGKSCPAQYATCKTYTASNGNIASYLSRSIDYGSCNLDSVGCAVYSTDKVSGNWQADTQVSVAVQAGGRQQVLYFNNKIDNYNCPDSANGCSLFVYPATNQDVYMKKAPAYLNCYDTNLTTVTTIDWPQTKSDLTKLASTADAQCSNYSQACLPEEVGCGQYTPKNGGPTVTGVVGSNYCPQQCIGYETFKQEKTNFESAKFPLYFIPANGQSCAPQYAGCDEFTNLGSTTGEQLEYYSDLKYCQQPENDNAKTYYSWEGSDSQGYILKKHSLLKIDQNYLTGLSLAAEIATEMSLGSPAYINDNTEAIVVNYGYCNKNNYDILIHNPYDLGAASSDCRALYDDAGSVYYRLLGDTVTVSNQCQALRKTDAEFYQDDSLGVNNCTVKGGKLVGNSCMRCMNGGTYVADGNYCKYWSIASEAESCPAVVNGCRLYIGNTGNNIHEVYNTSFEPGGASTSSLKDAKLNWGNGPDDNSVSVELEATQVGLHSLRVNNGSTILNLSSADLTPGSWYELSFWARGDSTQLAVYFGQNPDANVGNFTIDPLSGVTVPVNIGFDWQEYKLGPVLFNPGSSDDNVIWFDKISSGSGSYFLDNVRLISMGDNPNDYVPLIKDSWKTSEGYDVSTSCDSTPLDPYPGEYLGCRQYSNIDGNPVSLTGFQNLCRAEAVGCAGLVDTGNVRSENYNGATTLVYNALCVIGSSNTSSICNLDTNQDGQSDYSCQVEAGQNSCYIAGPIQLSGANPYSSVNNIPAPTPDDQVYTAVSTVVTPINDPANLNLVYLTVRDQYLCSQNYLGCQEVGQQNQILPDSNNPNSYEFGQKFVLNNPNNYGETLCTQEQLSCQQFKSDNTVSFFKDPAKSGALCVYKDATQVNGAQASGWFFNGVGKCDDPTSASTIYCKDDGDCNTGIKCSDVGNQACYPSYLNGNNEYGLWSNASAAYKGYVGTCNSTYNACTELVDPTDDQSYYVIADDSLYANTGDCNGKVSQSEGCVLFDQTENPSKFYDSVQTYSDSKSKDFLPVDPAVVPSTQGDSNLLLKVNRDRQCGIWLACKSSKVEIDSNGIPQEICQEYKSCDKMDANGTCEHWLNEELNNDRLTEGQYITAKKDVSGLDFSGYSLYNKYSISNYVYLIFPNHTDAYVAYQASDRLFTGDYAVNGCFSTPGRTKYDGDICGSDDGGRCFGQKCLYPIDGTFDGPVAVVSGSSEEEKKAIVSANVETMLTRLIPGTCKSYPEANSPFDTSLAIDGDPTNSDNSDTKSNDNITNSPTRLEYKNIKKQYTNAKICQFDDKTGGDCSCDYVKVEYKDGNVDYWSRNTSAVIPAGICGGIGNVAGLPCNTDNDCKLPGDVVVYGTCNLQKSQGNYVGLKGLCLEDDLSRPLTTINTRDDNFKKFACLTWLPVQESATSFDLYNQNLEAGYYPTSKYDSALGGLAYCKEAQSVFGSYDKSMNRDSQDDTDYLGTYSITNEDFEVELVTFSNEAPLWYNNKYGNGSLSNKSVFEIGKTSYATNDQSGVDLYHDAGSYLFILNSSDDDDYGKKSAYRMMQLWGWRDLSANARLLRLDLKHGDKDNKELSMFRYPEDKTAAMFSFAPQMNESIREDTGTAMHPPRLWNRNFPVPKSGVYNYFATSDNVASDLANIETSAYSPDFDNLSVDNKYIYVDKSVEKDMNEQMLDRVYFVTTMFPGGAESNNPATLNNKFYIDFSNLRQALKLGKTPIESHGIPVCGGNATVCKANDSKLVASYLLERNSGLENNDCVTNGLLSFCNYNQNNYNSNILTSNDFSSTRNKIYRRYVTMFNYSGTVGLEPVMDKSNDPFTRECGTINNDTFLAIGMDFNKDGEFLGYITRSCNAAANEDGEGNGISFATFAQFGKVCTDIVSVVNDDSQQLVDYNKAWTDRVWKNALDRYYGFTSGVSNLYLTSPIAPYGSLESYVNQNSLRVSDVSKLPAYIRFYSFPQDNNKFGLPYVCQNGLFSGSSKSAFGESYDTCESLYVPGNDGSLLANLFKKYYTEWKIPVGVVNPTPTSVDYSGQDLGNTQVPKIFAVNYATCVSGSSQAGCKSAKEGFTINNRNYTLDNYDAVPGADEDVSPRDGVVDAIISQGSYEAKVKFFGFADDNRMPIKRAMVDWGDGSNVYDRLGSSKNRKPYCVGPGVGRCTNRATWQEGDSQLTCKQDSECSDSLGSGFRCDKSDVATSHFGDQDRACTDTYFELSHTYFCDPDRNNRPNKYTLAQINTNPDKLFSSPAEAKEAHDALLGKTVGEDGRTLGESDEVCVFKPGVQVLDNWGWCNGSCDDGYTIGSPPQPNGVNNTQGCYDGVKVTGSNSDPVKQCSSQDGYYGNTHAWTDYRGAIIVIP